MMKKIGIVIMMCLLLFSCQKSQDPAQLPPVDISYGSFLDERDGTQYKTIKIGNQEWMAENLRYRLAKGGLEGCYTFGENRIDLTQLVVDKRNFVDSVNAAVAKKEIVDPPGLPVIQRPTIIISLNMNVLTARQLIDRLVPYPDVTRVLNRIHGNLLEPASLAQAKANFEIAEKDNGAYSKQFGFLYTHRVINQAVPEGWRVPTDEDWKQLEKHLGIKDVDLDKLEGWRGDIAPKLLSGSTESVGFDAVLGGGRLYGVFLNGTPFSNREVNGYYWTATEYQTRDSISYAISRNIMRGNRGIWRGTAMKEAAYHIKCLKNSN